MTFHSGQCWPVVIRKAGRTWHKSAAIERVTGLCVKRVGAMGTTEHACDSVRLARGWPLVVGALKLTPGRVLSDRRF